MTADLIFMRQDAILQFTPCMAKTLMHRPDGIKTRDPVMIGLHESGRRLQHEG